VNLPARMVKTALGQDLDPDTRYDAGKLFVRYTYELIADLVPFQRLITAGEL
jgi:carbamoyl-phosphate synthase large subunit